MNKIPEQEVFVIDQDAWNLFLSEKNKKELEKKLAQSQKKLYFIS